MAHATVTHRGITYTQVHEGKLEVSDFYHLRVQVDRDLTDEQLALLASLTGYAWASTVRGERLGDFAVDSTRSVVFHADFTKSASSDPHAAFVKFYKNLVTLVQEGSPIRKTDKAGPDTKGTRLVAGIGEGFTITLWVG